MRRSPCASKWSSNVWFPGASLDMPGSFGRHIVFALPSVGSSVSVLLSGNNGYVDEVDSSQSSVRDRALLFLCLLPPVNAFWLFLFTIFGKQPRKKKTRMYTSKPRDSYCLLLKNISPCLPPFPVTWYSAALHTHSCPSPMLCKPTQ